MPTDDRLPQQLDPDAAIFAISVAAQLAGMHPQTLRAYDRLGLVTPRRTKGRGRRYSSRDLQRLRLVQHLSQEEGISLPGIRRILELHRQLEEAQRAIDELTRRLGDLSQSSGRGPRLFTVDEVGLVNLGRNRPIRALPGRG